MTATRDKSKMSVATPIRRGDLLRVLLNVKNLQVNDLVVEGNENGQVELLGRYIRGLDTPTLELESVVFEKRFPRPTYTPIAHLVGVPKTMIEKVSRIGPTKHSLKE